MFGQMPLSLETVKLVVEISGVRIGMMVEVETVDVETVEVETFRKVL